MPANQKAVVPTDPRTNLEHLPDANLYDIARNTSAVHRLLCLQILVERCSLYAARDDVANEARQLIIDNPLILKKIDPASAVHALRLPNIIDVVADQQIKRAALSQLVSQHNAAHIQSIAALESSVIGNKAASDVALREAYSTLWTDYTRKVWQLMEDYCEQKLAFDQEIAELREEHANNIQAANERLALLERSPWRKMMDWCKKNVLAVRGWLHVGQPVE